MTTPQEEIAIINGQLVSSTAITSADLYISDGRVSRIEPAGSSVEAQTTVDATGKLILPGIIDAHLHPVYADRIDTLSRAAAGEGVTTLIPYIGAVKAWGGSGGLEAAIDAFIEEGQRTSLIDFGIHCTLMQADLEEASQSIPKFVAKGITSFKVFMAYAKRGMKLEDRDILKLMEVIAEHGGLLAAHAENGDIIDHMESVLIAAGKESPQYYPQSHTKLSEAEAIFRLLTLADTTGCPIYIPHISTLEALDVLKLIRRHSDVKFYAETCPHYLCLTEAEMEKRGTIAKMAPPLRRKEDIDALWQAVAEGTIDVIASDAAGNDSEANAPQWDKVFNAPNGIPGLESLFKISYEEGINKGRIPLPRLVATLCENPARIFGMYPRKGVLQPGSDADLVIVDPSANFTIPAQNRYLNVDYSLYEGWRGSGQPVLTMQRGKVLYRDGELVAEPGQGEFIAANTN